MPALLRHGPQHCVQKEALMSNPWLSIPLEDYEGHMGPEGVRQLAALAELFKCALDRCRPESVAVLGVAGGKAWSKSIARSQNESSEWISTNRISKRAIDASARSPAWNFIVAISPNRISAWLRWPWYMRR